MKISFINPAPNETRLEGENMNVAACPPLGILYLASTLGANGFEVSVLDHAAEGMSIKEVADWVVKEDPDVLGLSVLVTSSLIAPKIAEEVKKIKPDMPIVFGNHHATFNAERILRKYPFVDIVVRGEGEHTCLELLNCLKEGRSIKDVLGISFRHDGGVVSNPDRPLIKDIDALPFPQRDLIDAEYHNTTVGIDVAPKKFTSFLSSRGCVFNCRFCGCTSIAKNRWRARSIENIMDELHLLASEGYEQIFFVDDNFTLNHKRVVDLCRRMREEKLDIEWFCEGRVDQASYDTFREMVKAGCRIMYFGIESGAQKVLDYYDKRITPEQSKEAVEKARKAGFDVIAGSFILGAPNETKADIQETLGFIKRLNLDVPQINILSVVPGNAIWDELKEKQMFDEDKYWERGFWISDVCPNVVTADEVRMMVRDFYRSYIWSTKYIAKQVWLTMKSQYRLNVLYNSLKTVNKTINNISNYITL
ncbi:cobalamin-dependent protein [Candidatus Bathyarchaeota archaeon]|nr:cobalamin-dependent protein [Candidatus Bathyarchaeota archaeon]